MCEEKKKWSGQVAKGECGWLNSVRKREWIKGAAEDGERVSWREYSEGEVAGPRSPAY